eukprot:gene30487-7910_t
MLTSTAFQCGWRHWSPKQAASCSAVDRVVPEDPDDLDPDTLAHSEGRTRSPSKSESSWDYSDSLLDHSKRGLELARMGKHEEAAEAFEAAVLFEVEPIPALVNLGVIQMRIAFITFERALVLSALTTAQLEKHASQDRRPMGLWYPGPRKHDVAR